MTANELADELAFKHIAGDDNGAFSSKIITMLREQQAEIEKLGSELDRIVELYTDKAIENEALKLRYLTDEKIWKLWQTHLNDDITVFARAILKKAREK